ncbi:hypothetical protein [Agromyces larvae]|uniref:Uncharacterized protein n=1 Tax=Agromyces larvae TaxID=2929802 RepID=A0ABY4BUK4_9MICO|nr:hypothetical protein [Agromyces larvae]UOE42893.1 hypothetical protein MTO99_11915 [Agromyces larvae]
MSIAIAHPFIRDVVSPSIATVRRVPVSSSPGASAEGRLTGLRRHRDCARAPDYSQRMLIDSGTDLLQLALPHLEFTRERRTLIAIAMDDDLALWNLRLVTNEYDGSLERWIPQILDAVDEDFVRYFATVESLPDDRARQHELILGPTGDAVSHELAEAAAQRDMQHISHLFVGPEMWCSTGPMYRFATYPLADLPRLQVVRPERFAEPRSSQRKVSLGRLPLHLPLDDSLSQNSTVA